MLITEYSDKAGHPSINVYGELYVGNSPVVVGVMIGRHRNGQSVNKIQTVHPNRHFMDEVTADNTLYLGENKKETDTWFQALGAQKPPLGRTKYGFIRMLSQSKDVVKPSSRSKAQADTKAILEKQNIKLQSDVERLRELLKFEKSLTKGAVFTKTSVEAAARYLKKQNKITGSTEKLTKQLNDFYGYIAKAEDLTWEGIEEQAEPIVNWMVENKRKEDLRRPLYGVPAHAYDRTERTSFLP